MQLRGARNARSSTYRWGKRADGAALVVWRSEVEKKNRSRPRAAYGGHEYHARYPFYARGITDEKARRWIWESRNVEALDVCRHDALALDADSRGCLRVEPPASRMATAAA